MRIRLLVFIAAILSVPTLPARAAAPDVLATIKPVHSLVAAVMEGVGTPALLIGAGASAHSYVLKPSDAGKIAKAKMVFWIGPDLETFLTAPLANLAPDAHIVALEHAPGMHLLAARPGGLWTAPAHTATDDHINPHVWLDPENAIAMVREIARALEEADPAHAEAYARNAKVETERLKRLDAEIAERLGPFQSQPFIVFHDAYVYFDTHFHLSPIGAVTVEPDRPVSPRRIATLRAAVKAGKARCIFREPQFPPAIVHTLDAGTSVRVGVLDPLGADIPPGPGLYPQLLRRMAGSLIQCLSR